MHDLKKLAQSKPFWKQQRRKIVECLINTSLHDYNLFEIPTNAIRSHQKKSIANVPREQQELVLFNEFLTVCRGANTPFIQCSRAEGEGNRIVWHWADEQYKMKNYNICKWITSCFDMATALIELQLIISELRNDCTRGPTVCIFCSLVLRHIRKNVYAKLDELDEMKGKNLYTLQFRCSDIYNKLLKPLREMAKEIEQEDKIGGELINYLFQQKTRMINYHINGLIEEIISLALERYYEIIFEWITQCTLTSDIAHEFFIWDLGKQEVVSRLDFEIKKNQEWSDFDKRFMKIDALLPEDFQTISKKILKLGKYLYIMNMQKADLDLLKTQFLLDTEQFKNRSLGEFCTIILDLYKKSSINIMEHFKRNRDVLNIAKKLPQLYIGIGTTWIYEFAEQIEENKTVDYDILLQQILESSNLASCSYFRAFTFKLSPFIAEIGTDKAEILSIAPKTFPTYELCINNNNQSLKLAFPAKVVEPYIKIFYHMFLLNRAKYLVNKKYFMRTKGTTTKEEFATLYLMSRFLNVYSEYIYSIADKEYAQYIKKLELVKEIDDLVAVQTDFVNSIMDEVKLDQEYTNLSEEIAELTEVFCRYGNDEIDFVQLNWQAGAAIGRIKKFLLENKGVNTLKNLLFGTYYSAIGATAGDEPLWKLLLQVDEMPAQN